MADDKVGKAPASTRRSRSPRSRDVASDVATHVLRELRGARTDAAILAAAAIETLLVEKQRIQEELAAVRVERDEAVRRAEATKRMHWFVTPGGHTDNVEESLTAVAEAVSIVAGVDKSMMKLVVVGEQIRRVRAGDDNAMTIASALPTAEGTMDIQFTAEGWAEMEMDRQKAGRVLAIATRRLFDGNY